MFIVAYKPFVSKQLNSVLCPLLVAQVSWRRDLNNACLWDRELAVRRDRMSQMEWKREGGREGEVFVWPAITPAPSKAWPLRYCGSNCHFLSCERISPAMASPVTPEQHSWKPINFSCGFPLSTKRILTESCSSFAASVASLAIIGPFEPSAGFYCKLCHHRWWSFQFESPYWCTMHYVLLLPSAP